MPALAKLDTFTRSYIETALWASYNENGSPLDENYSIDDLAPETLARMIADCRDFQESFSGHYEDNSQAGHDFWLTRNRHGAGFWDGDYPKAEGKYLTEMSHAYGSCDLYVGDDDKLYLS